MEGELWKICPAGLSQRTQRTTKGHKEGYAGAGRTCARRTSGPPPASCLAVEGLALRACTVIAAQRSVSSPPRAAARASTSVAPPSLQTSKLPLCVLPAVAGPKSALICGLPKVFRAKRRNIGGFHSAVSPILAVFVYLRGPSWSFVFFSKPSTFSQRSLRRALVARSVLCSLFSVLRGGKSRPLVLRVSPAGQTSHTLPSPRPSPRRGVPISQSANQLIS